MKPVQISADDDMGAASTRVSSKGPGDAPRGGLRRSLPALATLAVALASTLLLTLTGCASSAGIAPHAQTLAPEAVGLDADRAAAAPELATEWWPAFGDPTLSALIERALAGAPSLKVAQSRLERAQAAVSGAQAASGPQVNGSLDVTRQHYSANGAVPPPLAGSMLTSGTLQAGASWEFDFFGRNRAALDAALGAQRAAQADVQAARVLLAAHVASTYVGLARLVGQREVARRSLHQREERLELIRQRVQGGLDTTVELRQGEGALPESRREIEVLNEQIALAHHALAALTVQAPDALDALAPTLSTVHAVPLPAAVPADLLGRRADVSAARWRVEAATHDMKSAKASFYPNINLTAFVGLSSIGLDKLVRSGSRQYGAGPAISLPIFDSGRLRANLRGKSADVDAAIESYNGTVIDAVHDVADQIASMHSIERQQLEQTRAQSAAESAFDLSTQRYRAGLGTYLTVLTAETSVLNQRRLATDLKARALASQVALIRALGGGYVADTGPSLTTAQAAAQ